MLEAELDRFLRVLVERYRPERIVLFGSVAGGRTEAFSDLDLMIIKETTRPFLDRSREVLDLLQPRVGVDVLVYTPSEFEDMCRHRAFLREEVLEKGFCTRVGSGWR